MKLIKFDFLTYQVQGLIMTLFETDYNYYIEMKSLKLKIIKPETTGTEIAYNINLRTHATVPSEKQFQHPYLQIKLNPQMSMKMKSEN